MSAVGIYGDDTIGQAMTKLKAAVRASLPGGNKGVNSGADNAALYPDLKNQLAFREANSIFTNNGSLKTEIIKSSNPIIYGNSIKNTDVINKLTSNGSSITSWAKMTTPTFKSPSGNFQVYFYQNLKTGQVTLYEMKVKFNK